MVRLSNALQKKKNMVNADKTQYLKLWVTYNIVNLLAFHISYIWLLAISVNLECTEISSVLVGFDIIVFFFYFGIFRFISSKF